MIAGRWRTKRSSDFIAMSKATGWRSSSADMDSMCGIVRRGSCDPGWRARKGGGRIWERCCDACVAMKRMLRKFEVRRQVVAAAGRLGLGLGIRASAVFAPSMAVAFA
jgi:hypothetical protein